jgi:hypothetical protein
MPGVKPGHGCGKMRSSRRSVFVDVDEGAAPPLLLHVALNLFQLGRGCAPVSPKRNAPKRQLLRAKIYASGQLTYITHRENATPFGAV